ncbi:MAG: AgmX/PglI C-terminal domain-containing protein [Bacteriovoracaceae bacterium]|jgi:hypothetical protein|nr:AgmX/PglI C-terminal domain-containing protein [Bacteriovoracaceae bacterium]
MKFILFTLVITFSACASEKLGHDRKKDAVIIRQVLRDNFHQFRNCYKRELDEEKGFGGKAVLMFEILVNGIVDNPKVRSNLPKSVDKCLIYVLSDLRFPDSVSDQKIGFKQKIILYPRRKNHILIEDWNEPFYRVN